MTDVGTQLRASVDATRLVQDVLDAATDILRHGNDLFHDVKDGDAYAEVALANVRVTKALIALYKILGVIDVEEEALR